MRRLLERKCPEANLPPYAKRGDRCNLGISLSDWPTRRDVKLSQSAIMLKEHIRTTEQKLTRDEKIVCFSESPLASLLAEIL